MSLARTIEDLEKHLDYVNSYLSDLKGEIEEDLKTFNEMIDTYKEEISTLEEQNELLEEQLSESQSALDEVLKENVMLNVELAEVTNQLIQIRHEK